MKGERNFGLYCVLAVCLLLLSTSAVFAQSWYYLNWTIQLTPSANDGSYVVRGMDVDQTNGDVFVAVDAKWSSTQPPPNPNPQSQVVWVDINGNPKGTFGPDLTDSSGTVQTNLDQNLWGVARDPKTGYLYLGVQETVDTTDVGQIHVIDPNGTPAGVWLRKFDTGMSNARGVAFSDDGMKLAVAGYYSQAAGRSGAQLYVRNLNGTPTDYTDDTWDLASDLMAMGGFRGLGDNYGWVDTPRDVEFDRNDDVYVFGGGVYQKYSGYSPYNLVAEYAEYRGRWAGGSDSNNNMFTIYGKDSDGYIRCWAVGQDGVKLYDFTLSGAIANPYCIAYYRSADGSNDRVYIGGADSTTKYGALDSYQVHVEAPPTWTLSGTVRDTDGNPINNATLSYTLWPTNSSWYSYLTGKAWHTPVTDANGHFAVPVNQSVDGMSPITGVVVTVDAPGYLAKRFYNQTISGDTDLGTITLRKASDYDSLTWTPLTQITSPPGTNPTMTDRQGTDDGILTYALRYGRSQPVLDPITGSPCFRIGNRKDSSPPGNKSWDNYLVLDVDDDWLTRGSTVWVTVEYLDNTSGTPDGWDALGVQADLSAVDPNWWSLEIGKIYKHNPTTDAWVKRTFKATQVTFGNMVHDSSGNVCGGDLRFDAYKDYDSTAKVYLDDTGPDYIKSVTISKVPPTTPEPNTYSTIAAAKAAGSGPVVLRDKVMTAQWNGTTMYVEETDRSSGIRVDLFQPWAENYRVGRYCAVYGTLMTDPYTGEPFISADSWNNETATLPPAVGALGTNGVALSSLNSGLSLTGLKVNAWGTVTAVDGTGSFQLDDGAGGVKVVVDPGITLTTSPTVGDYVAVVGIAALEGVSPASAVRVIKPWRPEDVSILVDVP